MVKQICLPSRLPTRCCRRDKACSPGCATGRTSEGWRQFFENYWRLIYNVARKSGLGNLVSRSLAQE